MAVQAASKVQKTTDTKHAPTASFVNNLYNINLLSDEELSTIYDMVKYKGFDRMDMLLKLEEKVRNVKLIAEIIIACALRGPIKAAEAKLSDGKTIAQHGIPGSGQKGTENLSCARVSASTADLAAFYLKRLKIAPRIIDHELPGWLQFPTAGSIKLPDNLRRAHVDFSKKFSKTIGGEFNDSIYAAMMNNAYLEPKLKLFDDIE
jgi:hypothetical protein